MRPEAMGGEVIAAMQEDAAAVGVFLGDRAHQHAREAVAAPFRFHHQLDDADLVTRQVIKDITVDAVRLTADEQRPAPRALREPESGGKPTVFRTRLANARTPR